jgi:AraC-like DNA-binding protein
MTHGATFSLKNRSSTDIRLMDIRAAFYNIQPCFLLIILRKCEKSVSPFRQHIDEISMAVQIMNKEYDKAYSLEDYSEMCHMSKYHFLRVFKSIVGSSPIEYRNEIRLEHAKELLCDTNRTISEISTLVGYTSSIHFCNSFKSKFGMSPSQYRKVYK